MEEAWKRFERSGSVSDYLTYVSENRDTGNRLQQETKASASTKEEPEAKAGGTDGRID